MLLNKLRVNQLSADGWAWYQQYLGALDNYDLTGYTAFLAADVTVQFNNDEPMVGTDAVAVGLGGFWGSVTGMGYRLVHEPLNIYGEDHRFVLEALNHYIRDADGAGGRPITVRATAWTDRNPDGRVQSVRLYQDVSPLYAGSTATAQTSAAAGGQV